MRNTCLLFIKNKIGCFNKNQFKQEVILNFNLNQEDELNIVLSQNSDTNVVNSFKEYLSSLEMLDFILIISTYSTDFFNFENEYDFKIYSDNLDSYSVKSDYEIASYVLDKFSLTKDNNYILYKWIDQVVESISRGNFDINNIYIKDFSEFSYEDIRSLNTLDVRIWHQTDLPAIKSETFRVIGECFELIDKIEKAETEIESSNSKTRLYSFLKIFETQNMILIRDKLRIFFRDIPELIINVNADNSYIILKNNITGEVIGTITKFNINNIENILTILPNKYQLNFVEMKHKNIIESLLQNIFDSNKNSILNVIYTYSILKIYTDPEDVHPINMQKLLMTINHCSITDLFEHLGTPGYKLMNSFESSLGLEVGIESGSIADLYNTNNFNHKSVLNRVNKWLTYNIKNEDTVQHLTELRDELYKGIFYSMDVDFNSIINEISSSINNKVII